MSKSYFKIKKKLVSCLFRMTHTLDTYTKISINTIMIILNSLHRFTFHTVTCTFPLNTALYTVESFQASPDGIRLLTPLGLTPISLFPALSGRLLQLKVGVGLRLWCSTETEAFQRRVKPSLRLGLPVGTWNWYIHNVFIIFLRW